MAQPFRGHLIPRPRESPEEYQARCENAPSKGKGSKALPTHASNARDEASAERRRLQSERAKARPRANGRFASRDNSPATPRAGDHPPDPLDEILTDLADPPEEVVPAPRRRQRSKSSEPSVAGQPASRLPIGYEPKAKASPPSRSASLEPITKKKPRSQENAPTPPPLQESKLLLSRILLPHVQRVRVTRISPTVPSIMLFLPGLALQRAPATGLQIPGPMRVVRPTVLELLFQTT